MPRHSPCALSTLTFKRPAGSLRVVSGAVFPWCAVRARGSFRQPSVLIQHPQRTPRGSGASSWERSCPVLHRPGLEAGRRKTRHVTVSLLVVFKTIRLSGNLVHRGGPILPPGWKVRSPKRAQNSCRCVSLEVEDTGIEPVTSSLQSWRSPS